jgi:cullin 1
MPRNTDDDIIKFDEGYAKVYNTGIKPFLTLIEDEKREFFKAKEFVELYDLIFKMCIQRDPYNHSEPMYEKYKEAIKHYLLEKVTEGFEKVKNSHETAFLKEWTMRWKKQTLVVKGMSKLFMYLDRFYTVNTDNVEKLSEQGYKLYKEIIFEKYREFAEKAILTCIERERNAEEQDRHLLQEAVSVFVQLGYNYADKKLQVYKQYLEQPICQHALQYYQRMARIWLDQDSCPNYLEKAEAMLQSEKQRVDSYLHHSTLENLTRECYRALLQDHQHELLSKKTGVFQMLSINAVEDLARLYKLYSKYPADLEPIAEMVLEHIKSAGSEVLDRAKPTPG